MKQQTEMEFIMIGQLYPKICDDTTIIISYSRHDEQHNPYRHHWRPQAGLGDQVFG